MLAMHGMPKWSAEAFQCHIAEAHEGNLDITFVRKCDWVVPLAGEGHYGMSLIKAFVETNWEAKKWLSGWADDGKLSAKRRCHDNHKT